MQDILNILNFYNIDYIHVFDLQKYIYSYDYAKNVISKELKLYLINN